MTTATMFPTRTAVELGIKADTLNAAYQKLLDEQRAVPAKIAAARRARNSGEAVFQQQREQDLPGEILAAKERADAARARFIDARNSEASARLEQERIRRRAAFDQRKTAFRTTPLTAFARAAAELCRDALALEAVEAQLGQNLGPLRMERGAEAAFIEVFASKVAQWLRDGGADHDGQWTIIDQITGGEGAALRAARDAFFGK